MTRDQMQLECSCQNNTGLKRCDLENPKNCKLGRKPPSHDRYGAAIAGCEKAQQWEMAGGSRVGRFCLCLDEFDMVFRRFFVVFFYIVF